MKLGVLAYGSLIWCPGTELESATARRLQNVMTPFEVEYARSSRSRGGGPTLVPVKEGGARIRCEILVLRETVTSDEAKDMIWRREMHRVGGRDGYVPRKSPGPNTIQIETHQNLRGVREVFYTKIASNIKDLSAEKLALLATQSVSKAPRGEDGITYLLKAKMEGIETPLSSSYEFAILRRTKTNTLTGALEKLRRSVPGDS